MDRGKAINAQRGEREPATSQDESKKDPEQVTARDTEFPGEYPEKRNVIPFCLNLHPYPIFRIGFTSHYLTTDIGGDLTEFANELQKTEMDERLAEAGL